MSSKDLNGLQLLEQFYEHKIDSLKIEGRMKSELYAATTTSVYAGALHYFSSHGHLPHEASIEWMTWQNNLAKVGHREYTEASLKVPAGKDSIFQDRKEQMLEKNEMAGMVLEVCPEKGILLEVRKKFLSSEQLGFYHFDGSLQIVEAKGMRELSGTKLAFTKPSTLVWLPFEKGVEKHQLVRRIF
jgi:putative protease